MRQTHTASQVKQLPSPTVKKLLREAGYTMTDIARMDPPRHQSLVTRVVKKKSVSHAVWERIAWCLNNPKQEVEA